jgi:hypothetical protein
VEIPARTPYEARRALDRGPRSRPARRYHYAGFGCEVGALGVQPGRSTASLDGARTVDYSEARDSMQAGDVPSSA